MISILNIAFAMITLPVSVLAAATCDDYQTPQQVLAGLESTDGVAKLNAMDCGVNSDGRAVRALVVQKQIAGLTTMSFDVDVQKGDIEATKVLSRMQSISFSGIVWSEDRRTFSEFKSNTTGQLLGGNLIFTTPVFIQSEKSSTNGEFPRCTASLTLAKGDAKLSGPLRCPGITARFVISIGL